jgi:hypothetical protein
MNVVRRLWKRVWRGPRIGRPVAELRELAGGDHSATNILHHLEVVLGRALGRQVFALRGATEASSRLDGMIGRVGGWVTEADAVHAWLRTTDSRQLPDNVHIEALVPIVGPSDKSVAIVAIGRRRLRRLSTGECSLVEAAIAMAMLLMQQEELRRQVDAAESLAGVVQRMAEVQRLQRGVKSYLDSHRN